ncbi:hypothetical protein AURANDRAFT_68806, partial [Aureococcus anophagefferens]
LAGAVASLGARAAAGGAPRHVDVAAAALVDICRAGAGGDVSREALGALLRSFGPRSSLAVAAAVAEAWAVVADADAAPGFLVACCGRRSFRHVAYDDDAAGDDDDAVERDVLGDALRVAAVAARDRDGALLAVLATPEPLAALHVYRAVARSVGLSAPVFDGLLRVFARVAALPDGPDARPYAVSCCLAMSAAPDARFGDAAAHFLARSDAVVARFGAIALMHATETADARLPSDGALRLCRAVAAAPRASEFRRPGQESVRTLATRALANAARKAGPDAVAALLGAALAAVDGAANAEGLAVALLNVAVVAAASPRGAADAAAPRAADALVALARAPEEEAEDDDDDDDSDADDDAVPASATARAARAAAHVFAAVLSPGWTDAAPKRQRRCCDAAGGASDAVLEAATAAGLEAAAGALEAAPPAPAPRRRAAASKKRVVDDADADDEDEAWEPGRPSNMDLDDDEQEQAAKAKRKLKRRSKKKSAKAKNAGGAAPHAPVSAPPAAAAAAPPEPSTTIAPAATQPVPAPAAAAAPPPRPLPKIRVFPQLSEVQKARLRMKDQEHIRRAARLHAAVTQEQERNAFLERIQAEEVRREQARIAAARPVPPPPNRATGAGDDSDEGWEESDEDDPVEDLIHRERIRERDLLRTPGCLALGRKAFRLEDMPRVTERDREILRRVLYILREAERRNCGELEVPRPREWALSDFGDTMTTEAIRARFDLRRDNPRLFS